MFLSPKNHQAVLFVCVRSGLWNLIKKKLYLIYFRSLIVPLSNIKQQAANNKRRKTNTFYAVFGSAISTYSRHSRAIFLRTLVRASRQLRRKAKAVKH